MTNEQIRRIYNTKMQNIMNKNARIEQDQDDADRLAFQKQQADYARTSAKLSLLGMYKDLKESHEMSLMQQTYDENIGGVLGKKFERKDPRSFGEVITQPIESAKRLLPGKLGAYQETEGYKQFKQEEYLREAAGIEKDAWEGAKKFPSGKVPEEIGLATAQSTFENQYKNVVLGAEDESAFIVGGRKKAQEAANIKQQQMQEEELAEVSGFLEEQKMKKLELADIENAKFNQYGLTKTRAEELSNILEREGVVIPPGMTEEKTLELLSSFDKVPMGKYPVGTDQKEYRAFVDTLKSGSQNPDTFQSVVTDLTENTDQTIQSVIDGTYVPEVEDVSYGRDILEEERLGEISKTIDPITGEPLTVPGEISPTDYTIASPDQQLQLKREQAGFDLGQLTTEKEALNIDPITGKPLPVKGILSPTDHTVKTQEVVDRIDSTKKLQKLRDLEASDVSGGSDRPDFVPARKLTDREMLDHTFRDMRGARDQDLEKALQEMEGVFDEEGKVVPEKKGLFDLFKKDKDVVDAPLTASIEGDVFAPTGEKLGAPTVPDAKPDGKYIGKALGALQTLKSMTDIGKTLTNEEASGADKAIAGTQGVKMLADMAAKKAGQKTAVEAVKAGTKIGGKAAVGAAAGGVIGGYTAVTEAKEAGEAWKEKDYDEAILHGIGSASGGLQTAGAGMMLTGVGAPLGAVLYGIGTAGSVISSGALLLEGLFGGGAPALPEVKIPKFNASRYLDSIRQQRRYN